MRYERGPGMIWHGIEVALDGIVRYDRRVGYQAEE